MCAFLSCSGWAQTTIKVPADQPTIQAGIQAANNGDTVLVAPGTYYESIDFEGKAIVVTSSDGSAKTILDGTGGTGSPVTFNSGETRAAVLSGMTIRRAGYTAQGAASLSSGGIYIFESSPTILNNVITSNSCWGVYINFAAPLLQGNTISSTQGPVAGCGPGSGAGIYIGPNLGSGVSGAAGAPAVILGNTVENNLLGGLGGGGGAGGGGIALWGGSPLIQNNIIRNNATPAGTGGGINVAYGSGFSLVQNLIYGNSAGCGGGAIAFQGSGPGLGPDIYMLAANNTIVDNMSVPAEGGSCYGIAQIAASPSGTSGPTAIFVNNIISGNTTEPAVDCDQALSTASEASQPVFDHNVLYNAGGSIFGTHCVDVSAKYGNIAADPRFVNQQAANYLLTVSSPAIDAGNNSALLDLSGLNGDELTNDFAGNTRLFDATGKGYPVIDIGAYEYAGVADASATTMVLASSAYTGAAGSNFTLTATIASALGTPTGTITFLEDGVQIGSSRIDNNGIATLPNLPMKPGTHNLLAAYGGQGDFTPAQSVVIIVYVDKYTTNLSIQTSVNPSLLSQQVILTVTTSSADTAYTPSPVSLSDNYAAPFATLMPNAGGVATYTISSLPLGADLLQAYYAGDDLHAAAAATLTQQVENGLPTTTTLTCNPATIAVGKTATIAASVVSANGIPTGAFAFADNGVPFGQVVAQSGAASINYSAASAGDHSLTVNFEPTGSFESSSAVCTESVTALASMAFLSASPQSGPAGTSVVLSAIVTAANLPAFSTPTGTVTFTDGAAIVGTANLVAGLGTLTTNALPIGTDSISCAYAGDSVFTASNCNALPVTLVATSTATTLTASATTIPALSPVTFTARLTGQSQIPLAGQAIMLTIDGSATSLTTDATGTASYTTSTLLPGSYTVLASFAGTNSLSKSSSAVLTETVTTVPTNIVLTASPNPADVGQPVTLAATVSGLGAEPFGATASFYDGATLLGTGTTSTAGKATFVTSALTAETHVLSASVGSQGVFAASTSNLVQERILPPGFNLSLSPSTVTLVAGQTGHVTINLQALNGFAGSLTLNHGVIPSNMTMSFSPAIVTLAASSSGSSVLTVGTSANTSSTARMTNVPSSLWKLSSSVAAILVCMLIPFRFKSRTRNRHIRILALTFTIACLLQNVVGCGSGYLRQEIAPGEYQIAITATNSSGSVQSQSLNLIVSSY